MLPRKLPIAVSLTPLSLIYIYLLRFFLGGFALFDAKWRLSVVLGKTQISEVVVYVWILFFVMGASVVL